MTWLPGCPGTATGPDLGKLQLLLLLHLDVMKMGVVVDCFWCWTGCECQPGKRSDKCSCADCKCIEVCGSTFSNNYKSLIIVIDLLIIKYARKQLLNHVSAL